VNQFLADTGRRAVRPQQLSLLQCSYYCGRYMIRRWRASHAIESRSGEKTPKIKLIY